MLVSVTDDDTLVGETTHSITVVDAAGALDAVASDLQTLAGNQPPEVKTHILGAIGRLLGENAGAAGNGAHDLLDRNNYNAALGKIVQALAKLDAATGSDWPELRASEELLGLTAKSVAVHRIETAEAAADKRNEHRKVVAAQALVETGDALLADGDFSGAASRYREAVRALP